MSLNGRQNSGGGILPSSIPTAENFMPDFTDPIPVRVNELEAEMSTLKYRVLQLEHLPPKVSELERAFSVMDANVTYIKLTATETKELLATLNNQQQVSNGAVKGLLLTLKVIAAVIVIMSASVSVMLFSK